MQTPGKYTGEPPLALKTARLSAYDMQTDRLERGCQESARRCIFFSEPKPFCDKGCVFFSLNHNRFLVKPKVWFKQNSDLRLFLTSSSSMNISARSLYRLYLLYIILSAYFQKNLLRFKSILTKFQLLSSKLIKFHKKA